LKGSRSECLVLLSGGIDSAACLTFYRDRNLSVGGVFVDYGQPPGDRERASARAVAEHYGIRLREVSCRNLVVPRGEIPGRNAFLIFAGLLSARRRPGVIALGIHAGTPYFDCSPAFAREAGRLLGAYTNGTVALGTPFLRWTRATILSFCSARRVPIGLTWSCEVGRIKPCGRCPSCRGREAFRAGAAEHD